MPEVVKECPTVYVESVLDILQQCTFASFGDVVVCARVATLGIWDTYGYLVGLLSVR